MGLLYICILYKPVIWYINCDLYIYACTLIYPIKYNGVYKIYNVYKKSFNNIEVPNHEYIFYIFFGKTSHNWKNIIFNVTLFALFICCIFVKVISLFSSFLDFFVECGTRLNHVCTCKEEAIFPKVSQVSFNLSKKKTTVTNFYTQLF